MGLQLRHQPTREVPASPVHVKEQDYLLAGAIVAVKKVCDPPKVMKDCRAAGKSYLRERFCVSLAFYDDDRALVKFLIEHANKTAQPFDCLSVIGVVLVAHRPS